MPDNPELDRYWAGQIDQKLKGLSEQFERVRNERIAIFTEDCKERTQYTEGQRHRGADRGRAHPNGEGRAGPAGGPIARPADRRARPDHHQGQGAA